MRIKIVLTLILLMFVFLGGILLIKIGQAFLDSKQGVIALLEKEYNLQLEVENIGYWPLNQLSLENVTINTGDSNLKLSAAALNLSYDSFKIIFQGGNWVEGIKSVKLLRPVLTINSTYFDSLGNEEPWNALLPSFLHVMIEDGSIEYLGPEQELAITNLSLLLEIVNQEEGKINLQSGLAIKKLASSDYLLEDVMIDQIELALSYYRQSWRGRLKTGKFQLENLSDLSNWFEQDYYTLAQLQGEAGLDVSFTGTGRQLDSYQGAITVANVGGSLGLADYVEDEWISKLNGRAFFNSEDRTLFLKGFRFVYADNPFQFESSVKFRGDQDPEISGWLSCSSLALENHQTKINVPRLKGTASLNLSFFGELSEPTIDLDLILPRGEIDGNALNNLRAGVRYYNNAIYLDFLSSGLSEGSDLAAQGVYNLLTDQYSLELAGNHLELALWGDYLASDLLNHLAGRVNTKMTVSGQGFSSDKLTLSGQIELTAGQLFNTPYDAIVSSLWLTEGLLLIQDGKIMLAGDQLDFSGELDFRNNQLALEVAAQQVDSALLNHLPLENLKGLPLKGKATFYSNISGQFSNPLVQSRLEMKNGQLAGYNFQDGQLVISYQNDRLEITEITAINNGALLQGSGLLELADPNPYLQIGIEIKDAPYHLLQEVIEQPLPLSGEFSAKLAIDGFWPEPRIKGELSSASTNLRFAEQELTLEELAMLFSWQGEQQLLEIEESRVKIGQASLVAAGVIRAQELSIDFALADLSLAQLELPEKITGRIDLTGTIAGQLNNPEVDGMLIATQLSYQELDLDRLSGKFKYHHHTLVLPAFDWKIADSNYLLKGKIENIKENAQFDLKLTTEKGKLLHFFDQQFTIFPVPLDYYFSGGLALKGSRQEPSVLLDFSFFNPRVKQGKVEVRGELAQQIELEVTGKGIEVGELSFIQDSGINLNGSLDFTGTVSGPLDAYNLHFDTILTGGKLNDFSLEKIVGQIEINSARFLSLDQRLMLANKRGLALNGYMPLKTGLDNLKFTLALNELPLRLLTAGSAELPDMAGYLDGTILVEGSLADPSLKGDLVLSAGRINLGSFPRFSDLRGKIVFAGKEIILPALEGRYGDGQVTLSGSVNPFEPKEALALVASGRNLPFYYGSFNGRFDPNLAISGSLKRPLLQGELLIHNFVVGLPFDWPLPEEENSLIFPELDLTLYPGEGLYLRTDDNSIDVLIQQGSLQLTYLADQLSFNGLLESEQGSFAYYNNKFILESGQVIFKQDQLWEYQLEKTPNYIPELNVKAWTRVSGTEINVLLLGPADDFVTTFTSSPSLSEDEILTLLTSKGGLGDLATGNWAGMIQKEIFRILAERLQLDLVHDLEARIQEIFSLDRMEIDSYNLGWEQEIAVYLGKYINRRMYLQLSSIITPEERDDQLAFRYYLTDEFLLEGSWRDEGEYRLSIETNLQF